MADGDRPGGAPNSGSKPTDAPPRVYPSLPPHVLERLAGYLGPGLRAEMAAIRDHVRAA